MELLGETGARWSEIQRATHAEVDQKRKVRRCFVKPGRWVELPAGPWVLLAAKRAGLLAPREDGKRFSYQAFKRAFVAAGRDLNAKGQTPHAIRAGRAVWDLEAGIPIWAVRDKLGHTSVTTTERYLRAARASALFGKAPIRARICPKSLTALHAWSARITTSKDRHLASKVKVRQWLKDKLRA